jgi:hypothetical protein
MAKVKSFWILIRIRRDIRLWNNFSNYIFLWKLCKYSVVQFDHAWFYSCKGNNRFPNVSRRWHICWAVSLTPATTCQRCHWHRPPPVSGVIDTDHYLSAVSLTPTTTCQRCHWHRLPIRRCNWHQPPLVAFR